MLKKALALIVLLAAAGVLLYWRGGVRIALDGSGRSLRLSHAPDYDTLEADRAKQRESRAEASRADDQASPVPDRAASGAASVEPDAEPAPPARTAARPAAARGAEADDWPDFRGPDRDGRYDGAPIRTDWPPSGLLLLWKQPIGLGYASFVIAEGRAFTIEQRRHQEVVTAYDVATGRELWQHGWDAEFTETMGGDGPRATPTYAGGRLYALGAIGELRCLDARTGALRWRRNILADHHASNLPWGMSASPLVVDDLVIVLPGGSGGGSVAAYHRLTGAPVWSSLDDQQAYTSPMLVTLGGVPQLLVVSAERTVGLTVGEGRLLWEYPWATHMGINVAQPLLVGTDRVFLSAGYGHGAAVFEVTRRDGTFSTRTVWQNTRMKNKFTSPVLRDGYIYGLDEAILACLEASTGALQWKGGRYGYGQVLLAGDQLIVIGEDGQLALVEARPDRFSERARFQAIEGKTWNHPVVAGGRLLVRNSQEMAAFDIRPR